MGNKGAISEKLREMLSSIVGIAVLFYIGPAIIILVVNFFHHVVIGGASISDFKECWQALSIERVHNYYRNLWLWLKGIYGW